jgi:membrane protease YdiL (CAAX protease family)
MNGKDGDWPTNQRIDGTPGLLPRLLRDRVFLLALLAGPLVWVSIWLMDWMPDQQQVIMPDLQKLIMLGLVYPILEEVTFRGALQSWMLHFTQARNRVLGLTLANLLTSSLFTAFHLLSHTPLWALLVFAPSLIFGELRDRYRSIQPSILLHCFYNLGLYLLMIYG